MKYLPLIWAGLFRKKTRSVLTVLSVMVAFMLFGMLQAVVAAFNGGASAAQAERMITQSKYSLVDMLPLAYQDRIAAIPGVKAVAATAWFGGSYQDRPAQFAVYPVDPEAYLTVAPELRISAPALAAWKATRSGAIVGEALAQKMHWKVGDKVTLQADIWPQADGTPNWSFDIVGTSHNTNPGGTDNAFLFRYDYFDQARQFGKGTVGWFLIRVDARDHADAIGRQIDAGFANSEHETKTQTEQAFAQGFAKQFGDIGLIVSAVLGAVFFTILVLTGNTMAQALRERIPELGMLKALGFSNAAVGRLMLIESLTLAVLGAGLGLLLAALALNALKTMLAGIGIGAMGNVVVLQGLALAVMLGLVVGSLPALKARRLNIVDALRA